eukprot:913095-Pelagomonas_calceolata.AAC.1
MLNTMGPRPIYRLSLCLTHTGAHARNNGLSKPGLPAQSWVGVPGFSHQAQLRLELELGAWEAIFSASPWFYRLSHQSKKC